MTEDELLQHALALLAPFPGAAPFGSDVRQDPAHDQLRTEVAKLDSPGAAAVDWSRVAAAGSALLATQSKDLLIAAYTAHALHENASLAGLRAGVALLNGLLDQAWDGMFPPLTRVKARAGALSWFIERSATKLRGSARDGQNAVQLAALTTDLARLSALVRQRFGAGAPSLEPLARELDAHRNHEATGAGAAPLQLLAAVESSQPVAADEAAATEPAAEPPIGVDPGPAARATLSAAVASWLAPIAPDAPCGKDARYDPLYEDVRAKIRQLDTPTGQPLEWKQLIRACDVLLKDRSKDLLIASYAAYGLYREHGLPGLGRGFALLALLMEQQWAGLYPDLKRGQKARGAALAWLLGRFSGLAERGLGAHGLAEIELLAEASRWLAEVIAARFDDEHRPAIGPVLEQIARLQLDAARKPEPSAKRARERSAAPAQAQSQAASSGPATASLAVPDGTAAPNELTNRSELSRYLTGVHGSLADLGKALRKLNPRDPLAYLLPRIGAALELDEAPPSERGRTFVSAPDAGEIAEIRSLLSEQAWPQLLAAAEASAANNPLFLDMQRLVHCALSGLGDAYAPCRLVVEAELAALLRRMPQLLELSFSNGSAFADADTRTFVQTQILNGGRAGAAADGGGSGAEDAQALADARALAVSGKKLEALAAFENELQRAASARNRFRIRLHLASAMLAAGDPQLATGLFGTLYDEIERRGLDEWEPELAADCLADYYECLLRSGPGTEIAQRSTLVYARLCRVDPRRALKTNQ